MVSMARQEAAGSSGAMSDVDSTEVVYKIRQWSLPCGSRAGAQC